MEKIKKILLFSFFVVIFLFTGYTIYSRYFFNSKETAKINDVSWNNVVKKMYGYCNKYTPPPLKLFQSTDDTDWSDINRFGDREGCYNYITENYEDPSSCKYIDDKTSQNYCYDFFAKAANDLSLCKTPDCISSLSVANDDPSKCATSDTFCKAVATNDVTLCDTLGNNNYDKTHCYEKLGIKLDNPEYCKKTTELFKEAAAEGYKKFAEESGTEYKGISINSEFLAEGLAQSCLKGLAVKKLDPSLCENIDDNDSKEGCYYEIATTMNDKSLCKKLIFRKNSCYKNIGISENDSNVCETLKNDYQASKGDYFNCNKKLAVQLQDPLYCQRITNNMNRDNCYSQTAIQLKNPELCENITYSEKIRESCYTKNAFLLKNPSICGKIKDSGSKDECYYNLAYLYDNTSLCANVSGIAANLSCISKIEPSGSLVNSFYSYDNYITPPEDIPKDIRF